MPLRRPTLRRLVGAQFLSETGDGVVTVALPLYVLSKTDSAIAMSLTFTAQMLGGALLGVVGGRPRRSLRPPDGAEGVVSHPCLAVVVAWLVSPVAAVVVLGVSARALGQLDNPSFDALIPDQVVDDLQQVLSLRRFIQSVSIIVGPAVGALTVWVIGEQPTLAVAAALFVAAICIHLTLPSLDHGVDSRRQEHHESSWLELASGMAVVTTTPFVRRLVLYWFLSMATVSMAMASAAVWFEETLAADGYWYGLSVSAYGIGTAAATLVFGRKHFTMSLPAILLAAAPAYAPARDSGWPSRSGWPLDTPSPARCSTNTGRARRRTSRRWRFLPSGRCGSVRLAVIRGCRRTTQPTRTPKRTSPRFAPTADERETHRP